MSADNIGSVSLGVNLDQSGLKKSLVGIEKQTSNGLKNSFTGGGLTGVLGKLGALAAGAFAVKALVGFGSSAIELGSNLAEVQNVVDVTFGSMSGKINSFAQSAMTGFGLSETSAKRYTGTMGAMLKSMGMSVDQSADMSMAMTGLAGDFASFYNLDSEEAFAKIRSGISGETEPLKQLGINMSQANLEAFGLSQGINKSYGSMTQAEQALLRYNYLMQVSSDAQGDFARTSTSWANQTRVLKLQWDSFKAGFGQGLINLFSPILVGINQIMGGLIKMGAMFNAFTASLFGSQKASNGLGQSLVGIANSGTDAANSQSTLADASKAAGKAAKGSVAGFDEVNTLQDNAASGSSGAGTSTAISTAAGGGVQAPAVDTSLMEASLAKLKGLFNFENIKRSWANLKSALAPLGENIWSGLKWAWDNLLVPFGAWVVNDAAPAFLDALAAGASVLNSTIDALKPLGQWLWDSFLQPLAAWTGGAIVDVLNGIGNGLKVVSKWINNNQGTVQTVAIIIGSFAAAWWLVNTAMSVWAGIGVVVTAVTTAFGAAVTFLTSPVGIVVLAIGALIAIGILLYRNWDTVKAFMLKVWTDIKTAWSNLGAWFTNLFTAAWTGIKSAWSPVTTWFGSVWTGIKGTFSIASDWFGRIFTSAWTNITNAFSTVASFFQGIWDTIKRIFTGIGVSIGEAVGGAFKGVVNTVIDFVERSINGWFKLINGAVGIINKIPGVKVGKLAMLSFPRLAQGGIVSQPTMAMVGDNRRSAEAVAPLHELMGMIKAAVGSEMSDVAVLLSEIARIMTENGSGGGQGDTILKLDGVTLARILRPYLQKEQARVGSSVIQSPIISMA